MFCTSSRINQSCTVRVQKRRLVDSHFVSQASCRCSSGISCHRKRTLRSTPVWSRTSICTGCRTDSPVGPRRCVSPQSKAKVGIVCSSVYFYLYVKHCCHFYAVSPASFHPGILTLQKLHTFLPYDPRKAWTIFRTLNSVKLGLKTYWQALVFGYSRLCILQGISCDQVRLRDIPLLHAVLLLPQMLPWQSKNSYCRVVGRSWRGLGRFHGAGVPLFGGWSSQYAIWTRRFFDRWAFVILAIATVLHFLHTTLYSMTHLPRTSAHTLACRA